MKYYGPSLTLMLATAIVAAGVAYAQPGPEPTTSFATAYWYGDASGVSSSAEVDGVMNREVSGSYQQFANRLPDGQLLSEVGASEADGGQVEPEEAAAKAAEDVSYQAPATVVPSQIAGPQSAATAVAGALPDLAPAPAVAKPPAAAALLEPSRPIPSDLKASYPNVEYVYYDVSGTTYQEVRDQTSKLGPTDSQGNHWAGMTNWSLSWKAKAKADGRLAEVQVACKVKVTVPRWTPPPGVDPAEVELWTTYINKLVEHENGHVEVVMSTVPAITESLNAANKGNAQASFDAALKRLDQRQSDYDAATDHGIE